MNTQNKKLLTAILIASVVAGIFLYAYEKSKKPPVFEPIFNKTPVSNVAKCELRSCGKDEPIFGECPCNCEGTVEKYNIGPAICRDPKG